jgi:hypothetical protein
LSAVHGAERAGRGPNPRARRAALLLALGLVVAAGCEREPVPARGEAPAEPGAEPAADTTLRPLEIEAGMALAVERTGSRQYTLHGTTEWDRVLRLSVEDGHYILFGPAEVPVSDGRFRIDLRTEPTDSEHIFFYITDLEGERRAVVPVDTADARTIAGPPDRVPPPPGPRAGMEGDLRTSVSVEGLESLHFRVRWPRVREGDRAVPLSGETDPPTFHAEIRRYDRVLVVQQPRVVGSPGAWNARATESMILAGIRAGDDAVVIARGADPGEVEPVFQPIRN